MNPRVRTALISVGCFVGAFAVVLVVGALITSDDDGPSSDALTVPQALGAPSETVIPVTGYLFFEEDIGFLLCADRTSEDPPFCVEPVMQVRNLDSNRFDFVRPDDPDGVYDAWSRERVVLLGEKLGAVLEFQDVLR